ncbi:CDP-diacylglycerol--glycerol-3-phosphate 3-phosphatidyltransferase [Swingsia samuiensis]|uniref:CDP-diacylglycerol--glycerol-3-phosphate 3-phosphatidyltransferase n=1 Tax=Swingsia samuiensis TaxID=1293412 RepID=A0A4Y6UP34_9PROT|nr:CDP-diacylglycerol--glycerol-3-phosphate 3-phosphatidyltransferase [Swingsia samuiensis]QDH17815.1 CDP-diacylglycerol--glycerol-3-phosphate 3-phosphatidyltransferase [Swingsia samuiensis]
MLTDLPNILTLLRIASIPVLVGLLSFHSPYARLGAFIVYVFACVTDYYDGALARRWHLSSDLGRMMDPIADKLLVGSLLLALAGLTHLPIFSIYAAILIMIREILVSGLREYMAHQSLTLPSSRLAKWKTGIQMIAIGFLVAGDETAQLIQCSFLHASLVGGVLLWLSVIPTIVSGWRYLTVSLSQMTSNMVR